MWASPSAQQSCKPERPGPKLSGGEETLAGDTTNVSPALFGLPCCHGRTLLRRLENLGKLSSKAALGWSGCVGSPQSRGTQGEGLQQLVSPLEGRRGTDLRADSLFQKDEPYPSLKRYDSPGKLKGYMIPKHQPGPQPRAILYPVTQLLPTETLELSHT